MAHATNILSQALTQLGSSRGPAEQQFALGLTLQRAGRHEQAAAVYHRCIGLNSAHIGAHLNLGVALKQLGRPLEALAAYRTALRLQPGCAEAHNNLGVILLAMGDVQAATAALRRAIELKPRYAEAHNNLGLAFTDAGRLQDAERAFRRALELKPDYAYAFCNLSSVQKERGNLEGAVRSSCQAIQLRPDYAGAYNNLGTALKELGRSDEALACYDKAAGLSSAGFEIPWVNKALLLVELGRSREALEASEQALAANGRSGAAWHARSELKRFCVDDPDIARMQAVLHDSEELGLKLEDSIGLQFALGKAWMDAGDPDRAFGHLEVANRLRRSTLSYDPYANSAWMKQIAQTITPAWMQRHGDAGNPSELPIFIVGMPRSGTSLVEQILASHPEVLGAGELPLLWQLTDGLTRTGRDRAGYPEALLQLSSTELTQLGHRYLERLQSMRAGRHRVVDKMPTNFLFAGLIHRILPNARIIHCRRDPLDTCLSCYAKNFRTGLGFAFDLRELGYFYRDYEALMSHWRRSLPAHRFTEVVYEELVTDLESGARRLVSFCGLDWDRACLEFHRTRRHVRTHSALQVRQPLYRDGIGRARAYSKYLAALREALGDTV